eukprot:CAMPEP_0172319718 /NCGR_PEP_ID=MMETSP1058-20130122/38512_1 /TAXON_ID=83371 /ORGANISM="Detonula confervacea, Strain CCMP 353" /LENGTH=509 /DNA_ID=CAMNT_0013034835 /DNA_START=152 /DNA_END=1681 /DNA_ORIENTATION=-
MDPDTELKFNDMSSTNERLMREMNAYLAAISYSPGEETNCTCETKSADNLSSNDGSLSARLKNPSISATSSDNGDSAIKERGGGDETKNNVRSGNKNLIPIDENGGESNPSGEYEYYNDFDHDISIQSTGQFDDDSLVAMAKQMDAASIISDPSLICGPSEKNLALPHPKKLTAGMKKLGQKLNNNRAKSASPYQAPPRPSARNPQQLNQQQMQRNHCTLSSGSPSSSKENLTSGKNHTVHRQHNNPRSVDTRTPYYEHLTSFDSANSFGNSEQTVVPETRAKKVSENTGRKHSSSKHTLTRGESKALRRGSGKKSRKPYPYNIPHTAKGPGNDDGNGISTKRMSTASSSSAEENTVGRKVETKSSSSTRRGKKGRKKRKPKQDSDSDEEPMRGKGFNTRIHDKPNIDVKPERIAEQIPKQPQVHSNKKSHRPTQTTDTDIKMDQCSENDDASFYDSDDQTQFFYESSDDEFESEEELVAVGTSVADAVACLNDKRAVTKVKNLFGIRG